MKYIIGILIGLLIATQIDMIKLTKKVDKYKAKLYEKVVDALND